MGDAFRKAKAGDPLVIPADAFNAFLDTVRGSRQRSHDQIGRGIPTVPHNCVVRLYSESIDDRDRYDILGVGNVAPLFDPGSYEESFKNYPIMKGYLPAAFNHEGKFAVLLEPVKWKGIARAVYSGVVPVRLDVPDADYDYCRAEITDNEAGYLTAVRLGSAAILWREGGTGVQWAIVRLGDMVEPYAFPITLTQTGGSVGPPSTWTYSVQDAVYGRAMGTNIDPTASPHKFRRPAAWSMVAATHGYAHWDTSGGFVIGWVNEMIA